MPLRKIELLWRARLDAARAAYELAAAEFQRSAEECRRRHCGPRETAALHAAMDAERRARAEYARILGVFSDLILREQLPPDPVGN